MCDKLQKRRIIRDFRTTSISYNRIRTRSASALPHRTPRGCPFLAGRGCGGDKVLYADTRQRNHRLPTTVHARATDCPGYSQRLTPVGRPPHHRQTERDGFTSEWWASMGKFRSKSEFQSAATVTLPPCDSSRAVLIGILRRHPCEAILI